MTDSLNQTPAPGVYPGVPSETYHRVWRAASNSTLKHLKRSPAHMREYIQNPPEDTAALITGRAVHTAILEPDDFSARYGCCPEGMNRTRAADKALYAELQLKYGPDNLLKFDEYQTAVAVRDAVLNHATAKAITASHREVELSLRFDDVISGVRCKARPDCHTPEIAGGTLWDIKTTKDASPRAFERSIFDMGYHRQAAFYLDGAAALGLPAQHFVFIAVEKVAPFAVALYRLTEGAIDAGREELKRLLATYAECEQNQRWPGYSDAVVDIALPAYAWSQIDEFASDGAA
jgi:hypothetical protein